MRWLAPALAARPVSLHAYHLSIVVPWTGGAVGAVSGGAGGAATAARRHRHARLLAKRNRFTARRATGPRGTAAPAFAHWHAARFAALLRIAPRITLAHRCITVALPLRLLSQLPTTLPPPPDGSCLLYRLSWRHPTRRIPSLTTHCATPPTYLPACRRQNDAHGCARVDEYLVQPRISIAFTLPPWTDAA